MEKSEKIKSFPFMATNAKEKKDFLINSPFWRIKDKPELKNESEQENTNEVNENPETKSGE